jgi:hypothetical protein
VEIGGRCPPLPLLPERDGWKQLAWQF